jgi:lysophospholipid hydrolase
MMLVGPNNARTVLEDTGPGGTAGFLAVVSGYPLFLELTAATDVRVAFLPKRAFDRVVDSYPYVWFALARRWTARLSPLVRQADYALDWVHMDAGQVLARPGEPCTAIHVVLNGRLRMIGSKPDVRSPPTVYVRDTS